MDIKEIIFSIFSTAIKIVAIVIALMFVYKYALVAYDYGYRIFSEPPVSMGEGRVVEVTIGDDTSVKEIGEILENKGLVRDGKLFIFQELLSENRGKISAGKYNLNTNMTADEMIRIMANADYEEEATEEVSPLNDIAEQLESDASIEPAVVYDEDGNAVELDSEGNPIVEETPEEETEEPVE